MPRKKPAPLPPPPLPDASPAAGEVEPSDFEAIDDSPDIGALVVRFQMQTELALAELTATTSRQIGALNVKTAGQEALLRDLSREVEAVRRVFSDLREAAQKTKAQMVELLKQAHEAAGQARDAAQVYERMADTRPDLIRRIESTNVSVAEYRGDVVRLRHSIESLSRRIDGIDGTLVDYSATQRSVDSLGNLVHNLNSRAILASPKEKS